MDSMPSPQPSLRNIHGRVDAGVGIHYLEVPADGPPLLLLHGIGMDWRVWQATIRRLSPYFHLFALDLRGHGQSDKPAHGYSLAHYAADVEDVLDTLQLSGAVIVGTSLGGAVAVAVEAPADLVTHRILVDPPLTGGPVRDAAMFEEILRLKHELPALLADFLAAQNPSASRFLVDAMSEMWHEASDGVIKDMLADEKNYFQLDPALEAVDSPVLLMQAEAALGGALSDEQAQHALTKLRNGRMVSVPGAGHAIHATKPAEFARLVLEFTGVALAAD
jgi:pimeloyl-ACP methyl ester carboxylesterase